MKVCNLLYARNSNNVCAFEKQTVWLNQNWCRKSILLDISCTRNSIPDLLNYKCPLLTAKITSLLTKYTLLHFIITLMFIIRNKIQITVVLQSTYPFLGLCTYLSYSNKILLCGGMIWRNKNYPPPISMLLPTEHTSVHAETRSIHIKLHKISCKISLFITQIWYLFRQSLYMSVKGKLLVILHQTAGIQK
jgi:hypothetical protein